jgi:hypothetical protein
LVTSKKADHSNVIRLLTGKPGCITLPWPAIQVQLVSKLPVGRDRQFLARAAWHETGNPLLKHDRRTPMRSKLYTCTKGKIVSARISDGEMDNVRQVMEMSKMSASEVMRSAFLLQIERFMGAGAPGNPGR